MISFPLGVVFELFRFNSSLQNRRNFFAFFRRTEASAKRESITRVLQASITEGILRGTERSEETKTTTYNMIYRI